MMLIFTAFEKYSVGPLTLYVWSSFFVLSLAVGLCYFLFLAAKSKCPLTNYFNLAIGVLCAAVLGSKLGYALQFPQAFFDNLLVQQGLTLYGGFLTALAAGYWLTKLYKIDFLQAADLAVLPLCLSLAAGRIGCLLINDHLGKITNLPWAVNFDGASRHPVAFYLIVNALIMWIFFFLIKNRVKITGRLFGYFVLWYSIARFLLDFTRAAGTDPKISFLSVSQWLSLMILLVSCWLLLFSKKYADQSIKL